MTNSYSPTSEQPYVRFERDTDYFAAIDLGTNNCRLMIASPNHEKSIQINGTFSRLVRLGEGLSETGRLSEPAMDRTIEALRACVQRISYERIKHMRCIATAACRVATNGAEFLARVEQDTGLKFDVLTDEQEAYYAALACQPLLTPQQSHCIVVDIGGGSTEIVGLARNHKNEIGIQAWHSLPIGVVSLSESLKHYEENETHYELMKQAVRIHYDPQKFDAPVWHDDVEIIGTSGTVTMLAGIYMNLPRYSKRRVDGFRFESQQIRNLIQSLRSMSWSQRAALGCIGTQRVDLILSGCAILETILDAFPSQKVRVADRGLREGILQEMMYGTVLHTPNGGSA